MEIMPLVAIIALDSVVHFFMMADIILFLRCFYDPGFQWNNKKAVVLLIYSVIYVALYEVNSRMPIYIELVLDNLIYVIAVYDYQGKRLRAVFRFVWVYLIVACCAVLISEIGSVYIFVGYNLMTLEMGLVQSVITSVLQSVFFAFIFFYIYQRIFKKGLFLRFKRREKIFAIVYTLLCIALMALVEFFGKGSDVVLAALGITFVLTAVLVPVFFYYLQISEHYQTLTKNQEAHIQAELAHFQQYQQMQEETSRFRHDIRNNLLCMNDMLHQGKTEELSGYLQNLMGAVEGMSKKYVTGDALLDSIVGVKAQTMEQHNIRFSLDGVLAGGLPWKPMDICNVFANALDNAIEACQKVPSEKREISMKIKATPQFWFITIENPVVEAVDTSKLFQKKGGYTSKANAAEHGIGTYSMKYTVESYGAMLNATCGGETFVLEIVVDKRSEVLV